MLIKTCGECYYFVPYTPLEVTYFPAGSVIPAGVSEGSGRCKKNAPGVSTDAGPPFSFARWSTVEPTEAACGEGRPEEKGEPDLQLISKLFDLPGHWPGRVMAEIERGVQEVLGPGRSVWVRKSSQSSREIEIGVGSASTIGQVYETLHANQDARTKEEVYAKIAESLASQVLAVMGERHARDDVGAAPTEELTIPALFGQKDLTRFDPETIERIREGVQAYVPPRVAWAHQAAWDKEYIEVGLSGRPECVPVSVFYKARSKHWLYLRIIGEVFDLPELCKIATRD